MFLYLTVSFIQPPGTSDRHPPVNVPVSLKRKTTREIFLIFPKTKSNIFAANYHRYVWIRAAGHRDSYASIRENCFRFFSGHPKLPDFVCNGPPTSPKVQDDIMMARYFELLRFGA